MAASHSEYVRSPRPSTLPWFLLFIAVLGIGVYLFRDTVADFLSTDKPAEQSRVSILTGDGVLKRIQALNNLESVAFRMETVITAKKDDQGWLAGLWKQKAIFIADGLVTAGVNLNRLTPSDVRVSEDGNVVRIMLPPAELLDVNVEKMETYNYETGLFITGGIAPELHDQAFTAAQTKLRDTACASDILPMATENAKRSVESLFALMDVEVLVETSPAASCASVADR